MVAKKTPTKASTEAATSTAAAVAEPVMINGNVVNHGDTKGGGSTKKQLVTVVPLERIKIVKGFNPRTTVTTPEVEEMVENIKKNGLLSAPLVRPSEKDGYFDLVCGEKRIKAMQMLGWTEVAVLVRSDLKGDDFTAKAIACAENSEDLRKPLNSIEIGRVCAELQNDGKWTVGAIAKSTGHNEQTVRRALALMTAPAALQAKVIDGRMSMISALEIVKLDEDTLKKVGSQLVDGISAADVKRIAKSAAKDDPANAIDGKTSNKKTGKARTAGLRVWKPSREKQKVITDLCFAIHDATDEQKKSVEYAEMRAVVTSLLWDRGDLSNYLPFPLGTTEASEMKVNDKIEAMIQAEAKKHEDFGKTAAAEGAEAGQEGSGEATTEGEGAPAETGTGKKTKAPKKAKAAKGE